MNNQLSIFTQADSAPHPQSDLNTPVVGTGTAANTTADLVRLSPTTMKPWTGCASKDSINFINVGKTQNNRK